MKRAFILKFATPKLLTDESFFILMVQENFIISSDKSHLTIEYEVIALIGMFLIHIRKVKQCDL